MCYTLKENPASTWLQDRKQWFIDRIGTTIYRSRTYCNDDICNQEYDRGIEVQSMDHANRLYELEIFSILDRGEPEIRFFDNLRDRAWFVFDNDELGRNIVCPSCDSGYSIEVGLQYNYGLICLCTMCDYSWKVLV